MSTISSDITERVAAIIGDTLNGWFEGQLRFDPIVVRQRYDDWYDEDYLEAWIVWDGDYGKMDHLILGSLPVAIEPRMDELGVELRLFPWYIAKWEWELNKERILK